MDVACPEVDEEVSQGWMPRRRITNGIRHTAILASAIGNSRLLEIAWNRHPHKSIITVFPPTLNSRSAERPFRHASRSRRIAIVNADSIASSHLFYLALDRSNQKHGKRLELGRVQAVCPVHTHLDPRILSFADCDSSREHDPALTLCLLRAGCWVSLQLGTSGAAAPALARNHHLEGSSQSRRVVAVRGVDMASLQRAEDVEGDVLHLPARASGSECESLAPPFRCHGYISHRRGKRLPCQRLCIVISMCPRSCVWLEYLHLAVALESWTT